MDNTKGKDEMKAITKTSIEEQLIILNDLYIKRQGFNSPVILVGTLQKVYNIFWGCTVWRVQFIDKPLPRWIVLGATLKTAYAYLEGIINYETALTSEREDA